MVLSSRPSPAFIVTIITINAILFLLHSLVNSFTFLIVNLFAKYEKEIRIKRYNIYIRFQGYGGGEVFKGLSTDSG